jgi:hypothetical protein
VLSAGRAAGNEELVAVGVAPPFVHGNLGVDLRDHAEADNVAAPCAPEYLDSYLDGRVVVVPPGCGREREVTNGVET